MKSIFEHVRIQARVRGAFVVVAILAVLLSSSLPAAQAQASGSLPLFTEAGSAGADLAYDKPAFVVRSRVVTVDLGLLQGADGKTLNTSAAPELSLNLFPDASYTGVIKRIQKNGGAGYSWSGSLKDVEGGYFYLVTWKDAFIAHVASPKGVYEVSTAGNGLYRVIEIDQSQLGEDAPGEYEAPGEILSADLGPNADSGSQIDVMVVYTPAARIAEGSTSAMKARIALAMLETNTSYAKAGVLPRLRLVHTHELSYTESGNISTDVNRLAAVGDGYLDSVHSLRNTYAADMVALIVENGGGYCGMAKTIMATATSAFQVTARAGCMTGYYTFGHEFGHLQGARHDTYVDPTNTPYSYGHGYVYTPGKWRTVMAYNNRCTDNGYSCTRLQYWSNPAKTYGGAAMGTTSAKNYLVLNNTAYTVANFRSSKIAPDFYSSFNSSASGWTPVYGTWALAGSAYYRTTGVANNTFSSTKHSGIYGDLTYEARMKRAGCTSCANTLTIRGNPLSLNSSKWWQPSYLFQYTNNGTFSVWKVSSTGAYTALKNWTASTAIVKGGWNTLKVVAVGSSLKFYINGVLVWSGTDASYTTGQVGAGMYRTSGSTGDLLTLDWAKASNTPTADFNLDEQVAPGVEIPGGSEGVSP